MAILKQHIGAIICHLRRAVAMQLNLTPASAAVTVLATREPLAAAYRPITLLAINATELAAAKRWPAALAPSSCSAVH